MANKGLWPRGMLVPGSTGTEYKFGTGPSLGRTSANSRANPATGNACWKLRSDCNDEWSAIAVLRRTLQLSDVETTDRRDRNRRGVWN